MLILEKEASKYVCPQKTAKANIMCVGSKCLAWRWFDLRVSNESSRVNGYCGLAGRPCVLEIERVKP